MLFEFGVVSSALTPRKPRREHLVSARLTINSVAGRSCAAQNRQDHGSNCCRSYGGVSGAEPHIDDLLAAAKFWKIPPAVPRIGAEQAAENHTRCRKTHIPRPADYAAAPRWRSDGATQIVRGVGFSVGAVLMFIYFCTAICESSLFFANRQPPL